MRPNITGVHLGGIANLSLMAEIKPGFVLGFETVTYVKRLGSLLKALNGIRQVSRESTLVKNPFPDSVGRLGIIQSFRYNIVPPDPALNGTPDAFQFLRQAQTPTQAPTQWLLLNVTFDGGWEPYMRVIYRDIGALLDALLCNCVGYVGSQLCDFDAYSRWVRAREVAHGLFYIDSPMTLDDQRYLAQVAKIQSEEPNPATADVRIAGFALEPSDLASQAALKAVQQSPGDAVQLGLKALKGLYGLAPLYPANGEQENLYLIRFAQEVLSEFKVMATAGNFVGKPQFQAFFNELTWFATPANRSFVPRPAVTLGTIQGGIVAGYPNITHGCLALLRVVAPAAAIAFLQQLSVSTVPGAPGTVYCNVALTYQGLQALGVPPWRLDLFPQEFIEGMEVRAGLLGDVRTNHPDHWTRPVLNWSNGAVQPGGPGIDLTSVHIVLQHRLEDMSTASHQLHPLIAQQLAALENAFRNAVTILSVQPTRRYTDAGGVSTGHFGFADGLSQPVTPLSPPVPGAGPVAWSDNVKLGELLLGHPGDRNGGIYPPQPDALLDNGTFLVVRKLRQRLDVLREVVDRAVPQQTPWTASPQQAEADLLSQMMGRRPDGTPLVPPAPGAGSNDFNYAGDPHGMQCPFQSHARRTNPRNRQPMPRIMRQGMSYGPALQGSGDLAADRGVMFMAYAASIAEQFEVIQRWVAGGNSSGIQSTFSDPFLGVPPLRESRMFRTLNGRGEVVRVDLGTKPIVELQWGAYLFVPSLDALADLEEIIAAPPPRPKATPPLPPPAPLDKQRAEWKGKLEDTANRAAEWQQIANAPGGEVTNAYGRLVADEAKVLAIFKDDGSTHSVCGYGARFGASIGQGYLGVDPVPANPPEYDHAAAVNLAIEKITEAQAFGAAHQTAMAVLAAFSARGVQKPNGQREALVDLLTLSERVLASLCKLWFGLPDENHMVTGGRGGDNGTAKAMCPGSFVSVSRYVFSPRPSPTVEADAKAQGALVQTAVRNFLTDPAAVLGPLAQDIRAAVLANPAAPTAAGPQLDLVARTIAGAMLGFPPTVGGNFFRILQDWVPSRRLWDLQTQLRAAQIAGQAPFAAATGVLRAALLATMRKQPVPDMVWRQAPGTDPTPDRPQQPVVVGIIGAMQDPQADDMLMFGGRRSGPNKGTHACPGYQMAMGVLLGMFHALLTYQADGLRPTPSDTNVYLINPA